VSYFRPQNVRKIATRSVSSLPNSTQNVSRKRGRVTSSRIQLRGCLVFGFWVTASQIQLRTCLEKGVGSGDVEDLDDMPVVTTLAEHNLALNMLKSRIIFLQQRIKLTQNVNEYMSTKVWCEAESATSLICRDGIVYGKSLAGYCLNTSGGPLTRLPFRSTITSTRSAIFTKGMPLFMP
jgi:hypothetical protein